MKKLLVFVAICCMLSISSNALCDNWTGNTNAFYGTKSLDKEHWAPLENHQLVGIDIDIKKENWPLRIAFGYSVSDTYKHHGYHVKSTAKITELYLGARKIFDLKYIRPFVDGGFDWISAETENIDTLYRGDRRREFDQDYHTDAGYGFWIGCGIFTPVIWDEFNIGATFRYSWANLDDFPGDDTHAGSKNIAFIAGLNW